MIAPRKPSFSIAWRLMLLFSLLLVTFTLIVGVAYNAQMRKATIAHYGQTMQRDAYAISQNLAEIIAPSSYNADALDETRLLVSEETLTPYLAFIEQLTNCSVYLVNTRHDVTGYFSGVIQTIKNPLLPAYLEQSIALGFMGKTPFIQAEIDGETHLTTCMPVMNAQSQVLGVVLLESTLREQGFAQVPSQTILANSVLFSFALSVLLAFFFSRMFTKPISLLQRLALSLAGGSYETRTRIRRRDEIGSLAHSMDVLAERLEESRRRDEQMRQQQQVFFANISHELRTPVTVIRGSLEALSDGVIRGEENTRKYYAQMLNESRWLQRLITDLLELSRLQNLEYTLTMAPVNLSELLGDVAMSAHALCEQKGVHLSCREPDAEPVFTGDYSRLRQMLLAVVDNSIKFTPPGKYLFLSLQENPCAIVIADEGTGIAEDELEHIFDRFRHAHDASRQSTGLGLAIVKEIANRHGVTIDVMSREGQGTVFTFTFPVK